MALHLQLLVKQPRTFPPASSAGRARQVEEWIENEEKLISRQWLVSEIWRGKEKERCDSKVNVRGKRCPLFSSSRTPFRAIHSWSKPTGSYIELKARRGWTSYLRLIRASNILRRAVMNLQTTSLATTLMLTTMTLIVRRNRTDSVSFSIYCKDAMRLKRFVERAKFYFSNFSLPPLANPPLTSVFI